MCAYVLVRVLERNLTNRMFKYRKIYCKELAHVIMEGLASSKSTVGLIGLKPRKANIAVPVQKAIRSNPRKANDAD